MSSDIRFFDSDCSTVIREIATTQHTTYIHTYTHTHTHNIHVTRNTPSTTNRQLTHHTTPQNITRHPWSTHHRNATAPSRRCPLCHSIQKQPQFLSAVNASWFKYSLSVSSKVISVHTEATMGSAIDVCFRRGSFVHR